MAASHIRVYAQQVSQIANNLENQNNALFAELKRSQDTIHHLVDNGIWEGQAAQATVASFDAFANKYFEQYQDIIERYVQFLHTHVEQGFFEAEQANISLSDSYK